MDNIFRIYCEDVNREGIEAVLSRNLEGYTIGTGTGFYHGQKEKSLIIDAFGTTRSAVNRIAQEIAFECNQESVAIVEIPCYNSFIFNPSKLQELVA